MRAFLCSVAATAGLAAALLGPAANAGAQEVVGQVPDTTPAAKCFGETLDIFQVGLQGGTSYSVFGGDGAITSWSTMAAPGDGQMLQFKVFHEISSGEWEAVGHDVPRQLTGGVLNTFRVDIPVHSGDVIGFNGDSPAHTACFFDSTDGRDALGLGVGNHPDGTRFNIGGPTTHVRANVMATFLQAPTASSIDTQSGSIKGGTKVVVSGLHLEEVQSVTFGSTAAKFSSEGEGQLTAVAPPHRGLGSVPVTVSTLAGSSSPGEQFAYQACVVPRLTGKKLSQAKAVLRKSLCGLGAVKRVRARRRSRGKVVKQAAKPGTVLAPGAKVSLKVGA